MDLSFDPTYSDAERRERVYNGEVIVMAPRPASLALVEHARGMIEAVFAPQDPKHAHEEKTVEVLARLKPAFIHHKVSKQPLRQLLIEFGCDRDHTFQDVPRLRAAYPADYLTTGIAYGHHPHCDTWYSAPACQSNWRMRWNVDFRTDVTDLRDGRGAKNVDSACTGTSLRDFMRVSGFAPAPEPIVASYETADMREGVAVFGR